MPIGLGCMRLSTDASRDPGRGAAVIAAAIEAGVTVLDTADAYALDDSELGHNERLIAGAVAAVGRPVEIATKGGLVRPGGAWQPDGRARHLAAAARASRDRLGVAAIDLYLLHAVDPQTPLATSVRALARLRDDGVVRRIGLCNIGVAQLEAALAITVIDAVEVELSPWKLDPLRGGLVAACAARGIRVLAHRPLGGPAGIRRAAADPALAALAARAGSTPHELVLAWLAALAPVIVPLPGATQLATARSAARAGSIQLDDHARAALAARFLAIAEPRGPALASAPTAARAGHTTPRHATGELPASEPVASHAAGEPSASEPLATLAGHAAGEPSASEPLATLAGHAAGEPSASGPLATLAGHAAGELSASGPPATTARSAPPTPRAGGPLPSIDRAATLHGPGAAPTLPFEPAGDGAVIVLVMGMPASGKSTLAAAYAARGFLQLNRDELGGSLIALARRLDRELARGARRLVIDNTYPTRASRAPVIEIARRHAAAVVCLAMTTTLEQAQHNAVARILARHGRLLMPAGPGAASELARAREIDPRAQFRFRRDHEPPHGDEGFAAIAPVPFVRALPGGAPGLIVELDGIVWRGRPASPDAIELLPGARDALHAWARHHTVAGTTWQPGLASPAAHAARLADLVGAPIDIMHCGHPAGPPVCWCRKPMPGLALALAHRHGLDPARTVVVGRGPADRGFASRADMPYADIAAGWPPPPPG